MHSAQSTSECDRERERKKGCINGDISFEDLTIDACKSNFVLNANFSNFFFDMSKSIGFDMRFSRKLWQSI